MPKSDQYQVNEIFKTVQGEGVKAGTLATFIRLQGCSVGCSWCDTKYTWFAGGTKMTVDEILDYVPTLHVVITGGEPTLWDLDPLLMALQNRSLISCLETSGQNDLKGKLSPSWVTWSPKKNLGYKAARSIFRRADEVKWVVDDDLDFNIVWDTWLQYAVEGFTCTPTFVLMPEGCPPSKEHIDKALAWLDTIPVKAQKKWLFGDRLQWRIGVR